MQNGQNGKKGTIRTTFIFLMVPFFGQISQKKAPLGKSISEKKALFRKKRHYKNKIYLNIFSYLNLNDQKKLL